MKILITVGTTPFNQLIKVAEQQLGQLHQLTAQISDGHYEPVNHPFFRFSDDIESYYKDADLIISHGGAGTIYRVLEMGKKLIIVPNFERLDPHQTEISDYMKNNQFAEVCNDLDKLADIVKQVESSNFKPYVAETFTGIKPIRDFLGLGTGSS